MLPGQVAQKKKKLYWADEDGDGDEGLPFSNL
jgi:hypothetical protein